MKYHNIDLPDDVIAKFCRKWKIKELAFFGSILREDFKPESDVDVLVTFAPDCGYSLFDLAEIQEELKTLLNREVDLVKKEALRNPFRKYSILNNMEVVYAAR